jgi:hypothetical protein
VSISIASVTGEPRDKFNDIFTHFPDIIPGLAKISSEPMLDSKRYLRLGDEDLILSDRDLENLLKHEAIVGARANRLGNILTLFTDEDINIRGLQTSIEAANYAEVLTMLSQQELVLQSSLGVGARVLTPSLIAYLL